MAATYVGSGGSGPFHFGAEFGTHCGVLCAGLTLHPSCPCPAALHAPCRQPLATAQALLLLLLDVYTSVQLQRNLLHRYCIKACSSP